MSTLMVHTVFVKYTDEVKAKVPQVIDTEHAKWADYKAQRLQALKDGTWSPTIPAATIRDHIGELTALGMNFRIIAEKSGVSSDRISVIMTGKQKSVRHKIGEALLAVKLDTPYVEEGRISAMFTVRRIVALMGIGWPRHELARRVGVANEYLRGLERPGHRTVSLELHEKMRALFEELKDQRGPRNQAVLYARSKDFPPAPMWSAEELDDPEPTAIERVRGRWKQSEVEPGFGAKLFDARESAGATRKFLAEELDVSVSTIRRWESGTLPWKKYRPRLARLLDTDEAWLFAEASS